MPTLTHQDKYYISLKYDRRTISFASDDCSSTSVSVEISMDPSRHGAYRPNFGTVLAVDAPSMFLVPRRTPSAPIPVMWDRSVWCLSVSADYDRHRMVSPFDVLGLDDDADEADVERAYRERG